MAGIHHGHILEFPQLRVDCFTQPSPSRPHMIPLPSSLSSYSTRSTYHEAPTAQYYFLTHAHTDHLGGLSNMHNNCTIYCSEETKALLLNYEKMADRMDYDKKMSDLQREAYKNGYGQAWVEAEAKKRKIREKKLYEDLQDEVVREPGQLDAVVKSCFKVIPYNTRIRLPLPQPEDSPFPSPSHVDVVMLSANHCPGSSMFLFSDPNPPYTAVLHTGDVRVDQPFLMELIRNQWLQPYLAGYPGVGTLSLGGFSHGQAMGNATSAPGLDVKEILKANTVPLFGPQRRISRIYLDTSAVLGTCDMPSREEAISGLLESMAQYPPDTIFHLHCWCFGYEEVLKAVARVFNSYIHVDRWKLQNYKKMENDPLLQNLGTSDVRTRFHACEKWHECEGVRRDWSKVVKVEFVEEKMVEHTLKIQDTRKKLKNARNGQGEYPKMLYCPLARHAPLPELQSLVSLFKPDSISPNSLSGSLNGCDYYAFTAAFADDMAEGGEKQMKRECLAWFREEKGVHGEEEVRKLAKKYFRLEDIALKDISEKSEATIKRERKRSRSPEAGTAGFGRSLGYKQDIELKRGRRANQITQAADFLGMAPAEPVAKPAPSMSARRIAALNLRDGWVLQKDRGWKYVKGGDPDASSGEDTEDEKAKSRSSLAQRLPRGGKRSAEFDSMKQEPGGQPDLKRIRVESNGGVRLKASSSMIKEKPNVKVEVSVVTIPGPVSANRRNSLAVKAEPSSPRLLVKCESVEEIIEISRDVYESDRRTHGSQSPPRPTSQTKSMR